MRVGVLGGGQLGRMLALAGYPLGLRFTFLNPAETATAGDVGDLIVAPYTDVDALDRLASTVDVVTYEFESVPVGAVERIATECPVWPPVNALRTAQDRVAEKRCFQSLDIPTAPFASVASAASLQRAIDEVGLPGVLKTRKLGYDGKGQRVLRSAADLDGVWEALGGVPLIYEGFVAFERELSIIAVRGRDGSTALYPLVENHHSEGILRLSLAPAQGVTATMQHVAEDYVMRVMGALDYVGVLAIEFFERNGQLLANEMAPRVHNSGHWTIEASETSQFENHVRAVCGLPLGPTTMVGTAAAMLNIIGDVPVIARMLEVPDAHLHLYGKSAAPRRKLGHVTVRSTSAASAQARVAELRRVLASQ